MEIGEDREFGTINRDPVVSARESKWSVEEDTIIGCAKVLDRTLDEIRIMKNECRLELFRLIIRISRV